MRMKKILLIAGLLLITVDLLFAQEVIPLYAGAAPGSEDWDWSEKENFSKAWNTQVVYNVSKPTLTVYKPDPAKANGTAVVVCPGGGFQALSINSEGVDVAKWLADRGITAFVLKYRLIKSETDDPAMEFNQRAADPAKMEKESTKVIEMALADGAHAIGYIRKHAEQFKVDPKKIGIIGFSAGGTVATGVGMGYTPEVRPDFVAPIYPFVGRLAELPVPKDAPPLFVLVASDDNFGFAPQSALLYGKWVKEGKSAELHIFAKGGHGFGMRRQNLPTDKWIELFYSWLAVQGLTKN
jgi:acetyl esterase/lipase